MITDHTVESINREIDGLNSPEESADLLARLPGDPEARELYDDLVSLRSLLRTVVPVEPPRYLKSAIIGAIPFHRPREVQRGWMHFARGFFGSLSLTPAHAFTFAGGLAIGLVAFSLVTGNVFTDRSVDMTNLYGTVMSADLAAKIPISDQKSFDRSGVHASATVRASEAFVVTELHFKSQGEVEIGIQYAPDAMSFRSFGQLRSAPDDLSIQGNSIRIRNEGDNNYAIVFERISRRAFPLQYAVYRSGSLVYSDNLSVGPAQQNNR